MVADLLASPGLCDLVTLGGAGLEATPVPLVHDPAAGTLTGHLGLINPQWRVAEHQAVPALVIVHGPAHYMSPTWRPAGGVPTWNYLTLHVSGTLTVHRDEEWMMQSLATLGHHYERQVEGRWSMADLDPKVLHGQLRAIVGIEIHIESVLAKAKLAQNLSEADRAAVIAELRSRGDDEGAEALAAAWESHAESMHPWLRAIRAGESEPAS